MAHILLVDDDPDIAALLTQYLQRFKFTTSVAEDAHAMRTVLDRACVDLIVLDWMLPGTDGLQLARELRRNTRIPVIMLTARDSAFDCVLGLESGADDFMSKPFEPRELVARIQALLRRIDRVTSPDTADLEVIWFDGWHLHRVERHLTSPTGVVFSLSNAEFRLLSAFLKNPRRLMSRDQLMDEARGRHMDVFERSVDLLVSRVRQKLHRAQPDTELIKTIRGAGYMLDVKKVKSMDRWDTP
jgi:two-component system OmpR family response regulator